VTEPFPGAASTQRPWPSAPDPNRPQAARGSARTPDPRRRRTAAPAPAGRRCHRPASARVVVHPCRRTPRPGSVVQVVSWQVVGGRSTWVPPQAGNVVVRAARAVCSSHVRVREFSTVNTVVEHLISRVKHSGQNGRDLSPGSTSTFAGADHVGLQHLRRTGHPVPSVRSHVADILADDVLRGLVRPQSAPRRVTQPSVPCPLPEADLTHDHGVHPVSTAGIRTGYGTRER